MLHTKAFGEETKAMEDGEINLGGTKLSIFIWMLSKVFVFCGMSRGLGFIGMLLDPRLIVTCWNLPPLGKVIALLDPFLPLFVLASSRGYNYTIDLNYFDPSSISFIVDSK